VLRKIRAANPRSLLISCNSFLAPTGDRHRLSLKGIKCQA
jgi:hypothetical protein